MKHNQKILLYTLVLHFYNRNVFINNKKSFTLIELVIVVAMIWILIMATTIYLWWSDEKRKIIEAQWCASAIWWEIRNYLFSTLTSKKLKISSHQTESPNYYIISLTGSDCTSGCNEINLLYSTWESLENIETYKTLNIWNTCSQAKRSLKFYRTWGHSSTDYVVMNKGFSPRKNSNEKIFYVSGEPLSITWDIIIGLCLSPDCSTPKEISKFIVDWRSQTISLRNCKFYHADNPTKCKTREGCSVYNSTDPTTCDQY